MRDLEGVHQGQPIMTAPFPGAVLSVNFGRPNATEDGQLVPTASLLGLQTQLRRWRSCENTDFVMVMLTPQGLSRLFRGDSAAATGRLLDVGAVLGSRCGWSLARCAGPEQTEDEVLRGLEGWLRQRLSAPALAEHLAFCRAVQALEGAAEVSGAARLLGISRRQLHRRLAGRLGVSPTVYLNVLRAQRSLGATQRGLDPSAGYTDQAHRIRHWRRHLNTTPGRYRQAGLSAMASFFAAARDPEDLPAFYL